MDERGTVTPLSDYLISQFDKVNPQSHDKMISVNPVVSEVATWYEKLRNAMDYREDDAILRASIERILKRRLLLGGTAQSMAEPLVRELVWARYFPDESVPESIVAKISHTITLYFTLQAKILSKHRLSHSKIHEFILQIMSGELENILSPSKEKELMTNFMYQTYKDKVQIIDDSEETKDAQIYIAVRRAFAKQDLPLLRYHLFKQLFGHVNEDSIEKISDNFLTGYKKIDYLLNYPLRDRIYTYIKKQTVPFYILEDVLKKNRGKNRELIHDKDRFKTEVLSTCGLLYKNVRSKVNTAIIRGVIFIFVTKALFALAIEGTYENLVYGHVLWNSIILNTGFPPILMIIAGFLIKTPNKENSLKINERIEGILFSGSAKAPSLISKKNSARIDPVMYGIFLALWFLALLIGLSAIIYVLSRIGIAPVSQAVFVFFLAIVSFIAYRITQTASMYTISDERQKLKSVLFDFFFMPFIHLGRQLTENIAKINLVLFVFDLIIETPFKVIFAFFEQWFLFLRTQREKLG